MTQYSYHDRTVSQFMVQGGEREKGESSQLGGGSTRSRQVRNLVPVEVRQLLQHCEEDGPFHVHGLEVGLVSLVGQVRSVQVKETSTSYMLEDRTGRIEVVYWHQEEVETQSQPAGKDTLVKVIGALRSGREQPLVTAYRLSPVLDMAEVTSHLLEISILPLRLQKMQARAASLAQATFAGNSLFGVRRLATQVLPLRSMVAPPSNSGDWLRPALRCKASIPAPAPAMEPAAAELLGLIRSNRSEMGATRKELRGRLRASGRLEMLLDFLAQEGHVYTTCDQDHFKATDA